MDAEGGEEGGIREGGEEGESKVREQRDQNPSEAGAGSGLNVTEIISLISPTKTYQTECMMRT